MRYPSEESGCLGLQPKTGGKPHLKLNTGERPIANKYREGKMKRTLKRVCKVPEIVERKAIEAIRLRRRQTAAGRELQAPKTRKGVGARRGASGGALVAGAYQHQFGGWQKAPGKQRLRPWPGVSRRPAGPVSYTHLTLPTN